MTIIRDNRRQLAQIRSYRELKQARERQRWLIQNSEERLARKYYDFKQQFTVRNLVDKFTEKLSSVKNVFDQALKGFSMFRNLFERYRAKRGYAQDDPQMSEECCDSEFEPSAMQSDDQ